MSYQVDRKVHKYHVHIFILNTNTWGQIQKSTKGQGKIEKTERNSIYLLPTRDETGYSGEVSGFRFTCDTRHDV